MNKIVPEIYIKNTEEALKYYEQKLGAYVLDKIYAKDVPLYLEDTNFKDNPDKVVYSELMIFDNKFIFGEDFNQEKPGNIKLWFECEDMNEFDKLSTLANNNEEKFIMDNGHYHIKFEDKYNIAWSVHLKKELVGEINE